MEMDNLSDIISSLSGEDVERLQSLASSIMGESAQKPVQAANSADIEMLMKAKGIIEKMNSRTSDDARLIMALKPYLSEEKKERAEQSLRLLNLIEILPYIKELF